jgi:cytochrome b pre-mRNA-processing protein 3
MFLSTRRRKHEATIDRLYGAIVAQARDPFFYSELGVPDTIEGRFDMVVLHVHLLFRRLAAESEAVRAVGQGVFDRFIADMDASLREIGVGDLSVPKRMRSMGEAYYGRAAVYDEALAQLGDEQLVGALQRNIFGDNHGVGAVRLTHYVRSAVSSLTAQSAETIGEGRIEFPALVKEQA